MARLLALVAATAAFGLGFALAWASSLQLVPSLAVGGLLAALVYAWSLRLVARGPSGAALRAWALTLLRRKGQLSLEELAATARVSPAQARSALEALCAAGIAELDGDAYRLKP